MPQLGVQFTVEAREDLDKLDSQIKKRIIEKILWLRDNFDEIIPLPLSGKWQNFLKLRVGDWRVIYAAEDSKKQLIIHLIGRRDKIYKR